MKKQKPTTNLVESAYQCLHELHRVDSFAEFGREISGMLGRSDKPQRWNDWRHGHISIPQDVYEHLLDLALVYALEKNGIDEKYASKILPHLLPPRRE